MKDNSKKKPKGIEYAYVVPIIATLFSATICIADLLLPNKNKTMSVLFGGCAFVVIILYWAIFLHKEG